MAYGLAPVCHYAYGSMNKTKPKNGDGGSWRHSQVSTLTIKPCLPVKSMGVAQRFDEPERAYCLYDVTVLQC